MRKWIVTLGGVGLLPIMPGTAGSFLATCLVAFLYWGLGIHRFGAWNGLLILAGLIFSVLCVQLGTFVKDYFGRKDPGPMVLDEAAGIYLTLLFQPITTDGRAWFTFVTGFVAFRLFDVLKPPPARQLESLPDGWGILLDDLAAAVYANLACQILLRWWLLKDLVHA